ncbi:unnamed protein product [Victoria cruziana]
MDGSRNVSRRDYERDRFRHRDSRHGRRHEKSLVRGENDRASREVENGKVGHKEQNRVSSRNLSMSSTSSSSRSSKGSNRKADREPGELSSGSEGCGSVREVEMAERRVSFSPKGSPVQVKKRKYSPIIWDMDEKVPAKSYVEEFASPPVVENGSVDKYRQVVSGKPSPPRNDEDEDDDYAPTRVLSASRWAIDNVFDGENVYDEEPSVKRKKSEERADQGGDTSPELGELREDGAGSAGARSTSGTDEEGNDTVRISSHEMETEEDEDRSKKVSDVSDRMEVDGEKIITDGKIDDRNSGSGSNTDVEVEVDDDSGKDEKKDALVAAVETALPRKINMLQGCRSVDEFERLNRIDEGTYGVVYRAKNKKTGEIVALKKVKMEKEREGFPLTSLREINILLSFHHPSIVDVKEVVVGSNLDSIFMVMEYMDHDLKGLMESMKQPFSQSEVKCLMLQLLEGIKYLHDNWVLHRDLKTSNLLLNNRGELKICDFGLARQYGSPLRPYTQLVVTLWYRAPELLLGSKLYSTAVDMWSLGCIMAELLAKEPLFCGKNEIDQLDKIFRILGTPNEKIWPGYVKLPGVKCNFVKQPYNKLREKFPKFTAASFSGKPALSDAGFDLLNKLLTYDPEKRITAEEALNHDWFSEFPPPKSKEFMPTFPGQHAQDRY